MNPRLHSSHSSKCACSGAGHFAIRVVKHRNQSYDDFISRPDAVAGARANRSNRISQQSEGDVSRKDDIELRSNSGRQRQGRTLNDSFADQLDNGAWRLETANRAERLERSGLLWHFDIDAIAHETMAQSRECGYSLAQLPPPCFRRQRVGVG